MKRVLAIFLSLLLAFSMIRATLHKTQTPRVTPMQQQSQVTILLVTLILGMSQYSPCLVPANFGQA